MHITRAVQTSMLLYTSRKYLYYTMIFHVHGMNQEEPCTDRYIICICHVYSMYKQVYTLLIIYYISTYHILTCTYNNIHICSCMLVYILVQTMYLALICLTCTISRFAGLAQQWSPAMTLPALASTWISLKQRSESTANLKQAVHSCPIEKQPAI